MARKAGKGCSPEERRYRNYGRVFIHESSQIFYSGSAQLDGLEVGKLGKYALPFYFQVDYDSTHSLFIRDRENRECYVMFDKNPETIGLGSEEDDIEI